MEKTTFDTSGQSVQKSPEGLFLQDGIAGLRSLPRHSVDMKPCGSRCPTCSKSCRRWWSFNPCRGAQRSPAAPASGHFVQRWGQPESSLLAPSY